MEVGISPVKGISFSVVAAYHITSRHCDASQTVLLVEVWTN